MKLKANRGSRENGTSAELRGRNPNVLDLDAFLPYRLSVLTNTISTSLARRYAARFGVSIPQWRVVAVLGGEQGLTAGEVAERTRMDKVSVSRAVSRLLAERRLLRRPDPADRRRAGLRLSARGRTLYEQIVPLARAYEAELIGALEPAERRDLVRLVEHLDAAALAIAAAEG